MRELRVLIVESNAADAALAREMLVGTASVNVSGTLDEAVELLNRVDVVLLALKLPGDEDLDALVRLRTERPDVPIVAVTADADEVLAIAAVAAGAQDYVLKSMLSANALNRALQYAVDRSELANRLAASIDELERQRASVLELNQLKNDSIAILAHDIKGPLTSVIGFAELLEEGFLEGDAAMDAAKTIRTNAQRLATLANDLLILSRFERGALEIADERVDLVCVIEDAVEPHAGEREITLQQNAPRTIVRGDAERLRQVFDNLIRNAIKYSPNGGPVRITLDGDGDFVVARVTDRGMGIPPDDLPKLFDRFTRGSNARKAKTSGTGIGLFIVKMILERHGGDVRADTVLGEGSTFTLRLPSIESAVAAVPMRVTLLTQDVALRRFAAYELRSRGYRVREAASLDEASDLRSGDIVLVDQPAVAPDVLRARFGTGRDVRLVSLGANGAGDGWDANLAKPFLVVDLLRALQ